MIRHMRRQNRQSISYLYVRCISAHSRPDKKPLAKGLTEACLLKFARWRIGRVRPWTSTNSWQLTPVSGPSSDDTKEQRCPKEEKGARALIACPALCYGPCSSQCVLGTWNIIRSCWKASFLRTRAVVCKLLLEPYGIEASFSSRKMKAKPHVVTTRCTDEWMRVPSQGCNSYDRCATNKVIL